MKRHFIEEWVRRKYRTAEREGLFADVERSWGQLTAGWWERASAPAKS